MFCSKCGVEIPDNSSFCSKCGAQLVSAAPAQPSGYVYQNTLGSHYAPGSFTERMHGFSSSTLFLIGIICYSAGNLLNIFIGFDIAKFFALLLLALPVTGFWLIYAASKNPCLPEKTMPALTLFKVSVTITFVVECIVVFVLLICSIVLFFVGGSYEMAALMIAGFIVLLFCGGYLTICIIYFKSVINIIKGVRNGITNNSFNPIPSVSVFTTLTYIIVGLGALSSLIIAASSSSITNSLYDVLHQFFDRSTANEIMSYFISDMNNIGASVFFSLITYTGIILCVITLNRFNNSLTQSN